jgi:hypothetical protein
VAGWEARKFPPDVPPLRVKWEAGSCCRGGGGEVQEEALGLEGSCEAHGGPLASSEAQQEPM